MKQFMLIALATLASAHAMADARSIETATCSVSVDGHMGLPMSFSLEELRTPKVLAQGGAFVLQAKPLLANPVMNDQFEDTVNPYGLELITTAGTIEGQHAFNGGEGKSTLQALAPLGNGQSVNLDAVCTVSYVE